MDLNVGTLQLAMEPFVLKKKKVFWEDLKQIIIEDNALWLLVGDLNEVIDDSEKQGGRAVWRKHLYLKIFIHDMGGVDLGHIGKQFIWDNGQGGMASIRERLDMGVADHVWILHFPKTLVDHLTTEC